MNFFSDHELFLWSWTFSLIMNFFSDQDFFLWPRTFSPWTFSLIMTFFSDHERFLWSWTFSQIMNFSLVMILFSDHELFLWSWTYSLIKTFSIRSWPCGRNHLHQLWLGLHVPHIQPSDAQQATGSVKHLCTSVLLCGSDLPISYQEYQYSRPKGGHPPPPPPPPRTGSPFSDTQPTF